MENMNRFERWEQGAGQAIRRYRLRIGWTQADLAKKVTGLGFAAVQTTIAKIEAGTRPIRLSEFAAIASALGLPWQSLLALGSPLIHGDETLQEMQDQLDTLQGHEDDYRATMLATIDEARVAVSDYANSRADRLAATMEFERIRRKQDGPTENATE